MGLCGLLRKLGYDSPTTAGDANEALLKLRIASIDLIIARAAMAPVSGIDLLRGVRADPELKTTPFILMVPDARMALVHELSRLHVAFVEGDITAETFPGAFQWAVDACVRDDGSPSSGSRIVARPFAHPLLADADWPCLPPAMPVGA